MTEDKNLLLSEVQNLNLSNFTRCKVHYDGFAGKGRDWEYRAGGTSFKYDITPQQAGFLSRLQDTFGGWVLSQEEQLLMNGIPSELVRTLANRTHVTGSAQVALYDLLK